MNINESIAYTYTGSPLGKTLLARNSQGLTDINFCEGAHPISPRTDWHHDPKAFGDAIAQLRAYFAGELQTFDLPLAPQGTAFQLAVWQALLEIPYGETTSYGRLARALDRPNGARAVGGANGKNPLPIVIPCHRVIGEDGSLTGYGGGLHIKEVLLTLEHKVAANGPYQLPFGEL